MTSAQLCAAAAFLACATSAVTGAESPRVERWGRFELVLTGPQEGNPFVDVALSAEFRQGDRFVTVPGFYDGNGEYRVRFMPPQTGEWRYRTRSNTPQLHGQTGSLLAIAPSATNHGPVEVRNTFHFAYADGTKYVPFGTTCYAWTHQPADLEEQTLKTLAGSPFNKLRMCVFPKNYAYNSDEPPRRPFVRTDAGWDTSRFDPEFFRHLERRVGQLGNLGIEADVILFHPYDKGRWGFDRMSPADDESYLRYVVARLAAYRNVWWSLANEYDFLEHKTEADWDRLFHIAQESDPYGHLRSIHNGTRIYNHTQPWVTHVSLQNGSAVADFGRAVLFRDVYRKPIVFDEAKYEGDLEERWGNLSAKEMVHRCWVGAIAGTYVGHGETYRNSDNLIWWAKGGQLHGESASRLAFLRKILETGPSEGMEPIDKWQADHIGGKRGEYYLIYLGHEPAAEWKVAIPRKDVTQTPPPLHAEIIDAWNTTITPVEGRFALEPTSRYEFTCPAKPTIKLPGHPMTAIRLTAMP